MKKIRAEASANVVRASLFSLLLHGCVFIFLSSRNSSFSLFVAFVWVHISWALNHKGEMSDEERHFLEDHVCDLTEDTWRRPPLERPVNPEMDSISLHSFIPLFIILFISTVHSC